MEGVMMRGPKKTSVAVRLPDETIDVEELKIKSLRERYKWLNWPFIRGVIAMYESMTIGFKALGMSADKSLPEDEEEAEVEEDEEEEEAEEPSKGDVYNYKPKGARKPVECEVTAVFPKKQVVTLKNLDDGKLYKAVPWDSLIAV